MTKTTSPDSTHPDYEHTSVLRSSPRSVAAGRDCGKDLIAGLVASVVLIANIVSFGALMFPGDLSAGVPTAIWAMLVGSCVGGVWIALATSLPPLATGIDSPTGTVLVLLSMATGPAILAAGGSPQSATQTIMLIFTAATVLSGVSLYGLGRFRWGTYFRFVPSCVVGGFLAATGYFLLTGAVRMTTGRKALVLGDLVASWTVMDTAKLASAIAVLAVLAALRRWVKSATAMPIALIVMWLAGSFVLQQLALSDPARGWYFHSLGSLHRWSPLDGARATSLTWPMIPQLIAELFAVVVVALISLITKVASIEALREAAGDLDCELRAHGIANLIAAPFGGITGSLQVGTSRLLQHAGSVTRWSGVVCALALGSVALANFDLLGSIPIPIVAGLVLNLGYTFIVDALWRPYAQRAWFDLLLCVGIAAVCIKFGYLIGVLAGLVCSCTLFALNYARLGAVQRHVTRAQFKSYVDRSPEASEYLREAGAAIHLYWLSGYIFFGSSEGVFERICNDITRSPADRVAYIILDFGKVSGVDTSAVMSLAKLRNHCRHQGIPLVYSALSPRIHAAFERAGFFGAKNPSLTFADLNLALAWCEDKLLAAAKPDVNTSLTGFESWLQRQLGPTVKPADVIAYLERQDTDESQVLYREGDPSDTLHIVAAGHLKVEIAKGDGESLRVRRIMTHTVVGEMGFFRRKERAATVSSDGPATLFTLTHANFERMRRERPDVASAFDDFIMRILADRVDFANRQAAALQPIGTTPI